MQIIFIVISSPPTYPYAFTPCPGPGPDLSTLQPPRPLFQFPSTSLFCPSRSLPLVRCIPPTFFFFVYSSLVPHFPSPPLSPIPCTGIAPLSKSNTTECHLNLQPLIFRFPTKSTNKKQRIIAHNGLDRTTRSRLLFPNHTCPSRFEAALGFIIRKS